jgi:hypothetical protein
MREGEETGRKGETLSNSNANHDATLATLLGDGDQVLTHPLAKRTAEVRNTGAWLTPSPSTAQGCLLSPHVG